MGIQNAGRRRETVVGIKIKREYGTYSISVTSIGSAIANNLAVPLPLLKIYTIHRIAYFIAILQDSGVVVNV